MGTIFCIEYKEEDYFESSFRQEDGVATTTTMAAVPQPISPAQIVRLPMVAPKFWELRQSFLVRGGIVAGDR